MEPDRIIKHVDRHYRRYMRETCGLTRSGFNALLPHGTTRLSDVQYSRLTNPRSLTPVEVVRLLADPTTQERIARALGCPGLFACASEEAVEALMEDATRPGQRPVMAVPGSEDEDPVLLPDALDEEALLALHLHPREERAIRHLLAPVLKRTRQVVCWPDPPDVGPAFLTYVLAGTYLRAEGVEHTFLIRPFPAYGEDVRLPNSDSPAIRPFERSMVELSRRLGLAGRPSARAILRALNERQAVLFVLHASLVPQTRSRTEHSVIRELIELASAARAGTEHQACVVLIGKPPLLLPPGGIAMITDMRRILALDRKKDVEGGDFFERQWHRFCEHRQHFVSDDAGARIKRGREYHSADHDGDLWPTTIRLLAFFASNYQTYGYFDPTAGWRCLAAMPVGNLPIDIRLHLDEAFVQLWRLQDGDQRSPTLRAARWCSTALYWVTEAAVKDLAKLPPRWTFDGFQAAVARIPHVIRTADADRTTVFKADLALRALIQDEWRRADPTGRAQVHDRIARRLYELRDDKSQLHTEFPIEPHWGRSRMHFLAECLRHFVRSCEHVARRDVPHAFPGEPFKEAPLEPSSPRHGTDPYQVINFCFAHIYWQELNGNSSTGSVHNRKLARQHGAYQLTGELLQLMSDGGVLGCPHWALDPRYMLRYFREVAYAQLDLGDLPGAEANFRRLIEAGRLNVTPDGEAEFDNLDHCLDQVVALTEMDRLDEAQQAVDAVCAILEAPEKPGPRPPRGAAADPRRRSKLQTRVDARQAQLHFLRGEHEAAHQIYARMEAADRGAIVNDVAHSYIATLAAIGGKARLTKAMDVCVRNLFESTSHGLHHQALGFRVALGHLFRGLDMIDVAEAMLDQVSRDIQRYGCSERTYAAFLLESGRVVASQEGRTARAYAVYLRPCFDRARTRGYVRLALAAGLEARQCLLQLRDSFGPKDEFSEVDIRTRLKGQGDYRLPQRNAMIDPQYAFDADRIERWVRKLGTRDGVDRELEELRHWMQGLDS